MGVEPTIRSAKGRISGFEGRDSHRTIFASGGLKEIVTLMLLNVSARLRCLATDGCYRGAIHRQPGHGVMKGIIGQMLNRLG